MHEGHRQRMIEKLVSDSKLSDHEILEILLFYAIPRKNVNEVAHRLIDTFGSLSKIFEAEEMALTWVDGIGKNTAAFIMTVGKCIKIIEREKDKAPQIFTYESCKKSLITSFKPLAEEKFIIFYLDKKGHVLLRKMMSNHSPVTVDIDVPELMAGVVFSKATDIVVCHNHLAGGCKPSYADDNATARLCNALRAYNVRLADHIIVCKDETFSYRSSGKLESIERNSELFV